MPLGVPDPSAAVVLRPELSLTLVSRAPSRPARVPYSPLTGPPRPDTRSEGNDDGASLSGRQGRGRLGAPLPEDRASPPVEPIKTTSARPAGLSLAPSAPRRVPDSPLPSGGRSGGLEVSLRTRPSPLEGGAVRGRERPTFPFFSFFCCP